MRPPVVVIAVLALCGCMAQRAAERNAPSVPFDGPLRPVKLSAAQIQLVQAGVTSGLIDLKDKSTPSFGDSYRAGKDVDGDVAVCGFVNGKRFVGVVTKPEGGGPVFLPIKIATSEEEQTDVRRYCRNNGIYMPG